MAIVQYVHCELVTPKPWSSKELTTSNYYTFIHYHKINLLGCNLHGRSLVSIVFFCLSQHLLLLSWLTIQQFDFLQHCRPAQLKGVCEQYTLKGVLPARKT